MICRICAAKLSDEPVAVLVPEDAARLPVCERPECQEKAQWISDTLRDAIGEICEETDAWPDERWKSEARRLGLDADREIGPMAMEVVYHLADLRAAMVRISNA